MSDTLTMIQGEQMLVCAPDGEKLRSEREAIDLIGEAISQGVEWILVPVERLEDDFFQLETTPDKRNNEGLFNVFNENFPITDTRNIFVLEFLDFHRAVTEGTPLEVTPREPLSDLAVIAAAFQSSEEGKTISIEV